jgi:hypothetical protein
VADFARSATLEPVTASWVFQSTWRLPAAPVAVYATLADVSSYPTWWAQVRAARPLGDGAGELTCRSLVPHDLTFVMHREVEDPVNLILRARLDGDLVGTSQWTVRAAANGSVAVFDEEVDLQSGMVRAAGRLVRPILRYNHDHMMRAGERGLRRYLSTGGLSTGGQ